MQTVRGNNGAVSQRGRVLFDVGDWWLRDGGVALVVESEFDPDEVIVGEALSVRLSNGDVALVSGDFYIDGDLHYCRPFHREVVHARILAARPKWIRYEKNTPDPPY